MDENMNQSEEKNESPKEEKKFVWKKQYSIAIAILLVVAGAFGYYQFVYSKTFLTTDKAKVKATEFINNSLLAQSGRKAEIVSIASEMGLYKMEVEVDKQKITAYMTKDGKLFFPEAINIVEAEKQMAENSQKEPPKQVEIPKSDKPEVQLYIMSYCPYGTQMQKGILPVLDTLKSKIKFDLKFVSYIMHDKKEIDENLVQYCIQKNEPTKLNSYLKCFLKDDKKAAECQKTVGVNSFKLNSCIASTDKEFKISEMYNDKSTWSNGQYSMFNVNKDENTKYQVQGSPTLIINGVESQAAGRDPQSILKTVCSAFSNPPKECGTTLSTEQPAPGFGDATTASTNSASCGN